MASMQRYIDKAKKDLGDFNVPDRTPSSKTEKDSRIKMLKDAESGEYKVGKKKVSKGRIVEMKKNDFSKMTREQLLELHRRQRDLGNTSATKNYKKGGIVKMKGGGAATRGMNFNRGY